MGCYSSKDSSQSIGSKAPIPGPSILSEVNFKIIDYTHQIGTARDIEDLENNIGDFIPTDIRCMRASAETQNEHSFVAIRARSSNYNGEICMNIKYSQDGFKITIGDLDILPSFESLHIEQIHFPRSDNIPKGGLREIVRWAFEHKDELYIDPQHTPELNMGSRVYEFIKNLVT